MKLRTDFVTNSSSSSFIFGKAGDNTTAEVVYEIVRGIYLEMIEKIDALKKVQSEYSLEFTKTDDGFLHFKNISEDHSFEYMDKIDAKIKKKYGVSIYWYLRDALEWISCKTYKEYTEYWLNRIKEHPEGRYAPFVIVDTTQETYIPFYYTVKEDRNPIFDIQEGEIFTWYVPCKYAAKFYDTPSFSVKDKSYCEYCYLKKDDCKKFKEGAKDGTLNQSNVMALTLGTVAVLSECGYMPDFVVDNLIKICNYGCNHMG